MVKKIKKQKKTIFGFISKILILCFLFVLAILFFVFGGRVGYWFDRLGDSLIKDNNFTDITDTVSDELIVDGFQDGLVADPIVVNQATVEVTVQLDQNEYDRRMDLLAGGDGGGQRLEKVLATSTLRVQFVDGSEGVIETPLYLEKVVASKRATGWPVDPDVYPLAGALLPFNRIVAYYGHLNSVGMGALGELYNNGGEEVLLQKLKEEVERWRRADPDTPVIPALHEIVTSAQSSPQGDGSYSAYISDDKVDKVIAMADKIDGIVFLDFQVGLSNLATQLIHYQKYFTLPEVHLGIDPEFSMKDGTAPGKKVGYFEAEDINYTIDWLAEIVREHNLPPKILVVHRFQMGMITDYQKIKKVPEVQVVIDADGHGLYAGDYLRSAIDQKTGIYHQLMTEPIQFAGIKIFYKNDTNMKGTSLIEIFNKYLNLDTGKCSGISADQLWFSHKPCWDLMTPQDVLNLRPVPIYIQYQ